MCKLENTVATCAPCLNLAQSSNLKIRPAATVDPYSAPVVTPSASVNTVGVTALADESHPAVGIDRARPASHIVGRAINDLYAGSARLPAAASSANLEIGATAAVDPDTPTFVSPRTAEVARRAADLANDAHPAACVGGAHVASAIVGGAVNVVTLVPPAPAGAANLKIAAATAIHPDTAAVHIAPRLIEDASSVTALLDQLHATPDIGGAVISPHVVGGTGNDLALGRAKAGCGGLRHARHRDRNGQNGYEAECPEGLHWGTSARIGV